MQTKNDAKIPSYCSTSCTALSKCPGGQRPNPCQIKLLLVLQVRWSSVYSRDSGARRPSLVTKAGNSWTPWMNSSAEIWISEEISAVHTTRSPTAWPRGLIRLSFTNCESLSTRIWTTGAPLFPGCWCLTVPTSNRPQSFHHSSPFMGSRCACQSRWMAQILNTYLSPLSMRKKIWMCGWRELRASRPSALHARRTSWPHKKSKSSNIMLSVSHQPSQSVTSCGIVATAATREKVGS